MSSVTSSVIGDDGVLHVALESGVCAIATGTNGPTEAPWPMYRGNARHAGKIEKPALKQPRKRADANFEFQHHAQLGQTNTVETSTNLSTWTSFTSVVVTTLPQLVVEFTAINHFTHSYRTTTPPQAGESAASLRSARARREPRVLRAHSRIRHLWGSETTTAALQALLHCFRDSC
jgi:hypothetical protein